MAKELEDYAVLLLDEHGYIESQNKGAEKIKGYLPGKIVGQNFSVFYTREDREKGLPEKLIKEAITNGEAIYEGWSVRKNGTKFWGNVILTTLYNKAGAVSGFSKITHDNSSKHTDQAHQANNMAGGDAQGSFDEKNLYALINNTHDLMWSLDCNYKLITSNRAFNEMVWHMSGISISRGSDVLANGFTDEQLIRYKQFYDRAFSGEDFKVEEYSELPAVYWSELSFQPIRIDDEIIGAACHAHDITAQKLANEKILNIQRLYAFISQINQTISHSVDEKTVFEKSCDIAIHIGKFDLAWIGMPDKKNKKLNVVSYCNATASQLVSLQKLDFDDDGPTASVLKSGENYVINDFESAPDNSSSKRFASQNGFRSFISLPLNKGGKTIGTFNLISVHANIFDEQEIKLLTEASGDISFALDVFEKEKHRKQMEEKIAHSELRLKQAQAIAHIGNWELDLATGVVIWSEEACRIYGFPPEENIQSYTSWVSSIHPDDMAYVMKMTKEGQDTLSNSAFHHRIIRKDGVIRHIYSQSQFELDKEGKPVAIYGVAHDITEQVQAEKEREKIMADIVQRNNNLEQFSYIVSHNLRAPVANILGLVNIIQAIGIDASEETKTTRYLEKAAKTLDNVVIDMNNVLEIKHNLMENREKVKFEEILKQIELRFDNTLNDEKITIISDFSEIGEMTTIKSRIYSIFYNLISNGLKYRRPGIPPIIEITSRTINNNIQITFKDNGLGIDVEKNADLLFGLYKRFHYHVEGKGLGLFMVKAQVEALGGKITLLSEVNEGCEFTIEFDDAIN